MDFEFCEGLSEAGSLNRLGSSVLIARCRVAGQKENLGGKARAEVGLFIRNAQSPFTTPPIEHPIFT